MTLKRKIHWDHKSFFKIYSLWLIGIILNILPIILNVFKTFLTDDSNNFCFRVAFWGRLDFVSINFILAFLIFIELVFFKGTMVKENDPHWNEVYNKMTTAIKAILLVMTGLLVFIYIVATFSSEWEEKISVNFLIYVNIITLILVFFLGTVHFLLSTMRTTIELKEGV